MIEIMEVINSDSLWSVILIPQVLWNNFFNLRGETSFLFIYFFLKISCALDLALSVLGSTVFLSCILSRSQFDPSRSLFFFLENATFVIIFSLLSGGKWSAKTLELRFPTSCICNQLREWYCLEVLQMFWTLAEELFEFLISSVGSELFDELLFVNIRTIFVLHGMMCHTCRAEGACTCRSWFSNAANKINR